MASRRFAAPNSLVGPLNTQRSTFTIRATSTTHRPLPDFNDDLDDGPKTLSTLSVAVTPRALARTASETEVPHDTLRGTSKATAPAMSFLDEREALIICVANVWNPYHTARTIDNRPQFLALPRTSQHQLRDRDLRRLQPNVYGNNMTMRAEAPVATIHALDEGVPLVQTVHRVRAWPSPRPDRNFISQYHLSGPRSDGFPSAGGVPPITWTPFSSPTHFLHPTLVRRLATHREAT
ncbi:hypothetical protein D9619_009220 [Psilocybe cf. subviscida]|uniref:Uncharacterized protein n=1 Tax=Psilocybe cf. subviscida TaxID=2480587 RepID=A0A8H5FAE3_9AGAR|nr:hypothetical protein D9619_009220 [Psilocybe cf. subviscida]